MEQYGDQIDAGPSNVEPETAFPYDAVFISHSKATRCYGCNGRVRNTASDPPPPAPHDMLLRHKECRVYKRRGETTIRITKTPEAVYYHPLSSCAPLASRNNINIEEGVLCKLVETNKQLLWRKFGIRFFRLGEILTSQTKYLLCFVSVSKIFIATHWYIVNDANILF